MKIKSIMVAALAALTFASCSKDDNGGQGNGGAKGGEKAIMNVAFTLPTSNTRAQETEDALDEECTVKTVDIFIFDSDGIVASEGGYKSFNATTDFDASGNTYKLKEAYETVSGSGMSIYVALNLPSDFQKSYGTENMLLQQIDEVEAMTVADNFLMFSDKEIANLKAKDHADLVATDGVNIVKMKVGRVASKVVASYDDTGSYTMKWTYGEGADEVAIPFEYTIKAFNVYQEAIKSFVAPNAKTLINNYPAESDWNKVLSLYATSVLNDNIDMLPHPAAADQKDMDCVYVGENNPITAKNGNTTYAMIATTLKLDKAAKWDNTKKAVVYGDVPEYGKGSSDIYVIKHMGITYVTNTKTNVDEISGGLKVLHDEPIATAKYYHYRDGYVHFLVWLNRYGDNDYRIGRNEFVHIKVNGVEDQDGTFPGYPGIEGETDKPIDPNTDGGNNPDPIIPTDPVDPEKAALKVEVTVEPWTYKENPVILN